MHRTSRSDLPDHHPTPALPTAPRPASHEGERDPWVDAVRAAALLVVVLGHWLLPVISRDGDGELGFASLLVVAPWTAWLTLVLQVMGAFFFVGGIVSVRSWRRARSDAGTTRAAYPAWVARRVVGLLRPATPVLLLWVAAAPVLRSFGMAEDLVAVAAQSALAPLWFLSVYALAQALLPLLDATVRRFGAARVTGVLLASSLLLDLLGRHLLIEAVRPAAFLVVWSVPLVLGIAHVDGTLRARHGRQLCLVGGLALVVLVAGIGYPLMMVGTLPDLGSNQSPPSAALAALVLVHVGVLLETRGRVAAWLHGGPGDRRQRLVGAAAAWSMGMFLWHMTAMVLALGVAVVWPGGLAAVATGGLLGIPPLTAAWWLSRVAWWLVLLVWTVPLVALAASPSRRRQRTATGDAPRGRRLATAQRSPAAAWRAAVDGPAGSALVGAAVALAASALAVVGAVPERTAFAGSSLAVTLICLRALSSAGRASVTGAGASYAPVEPAGGEDVSLQKDPCVR